MADPPKNPAKYLLLEVPNFNLASGEDAAMSSYLRLGAVADLSIAGKAGAPKSSGEDLAAKVTSFQDDDRLRDGCPDFVSPGERQAETAKLHTKGGWRDHSDGNRVTTTRGDKIEVIQGNYTQLILGRGDDEAIWDVSGGHVYQNDITFGGSTKIEWVQIYDGTWKVTEKTFKGDVDTTYVGDTVDYYYGKRKESTTGSEQPCTPSGNEAPEEMEYVKYKYNPRIIDRTWAESMESYTGSEALRVPSITDETWAGEIVSSTHAGSMTDETIVDDAIRSTTKADTIRSETTARVMRSTTHADTIDDTTYGDSTSTTHGNTRSFNYGNDFTMVQGISTEVMILGSNEVTVGEEVSVTVGAVVDVSLAAKLEIDLGASLSITLGPKVELLTSETKIVASETTVSGETSEINGFRSMIGAVISLF
jgi:hypothetical protein